MNIQNNPPKRLLDQLRECIRLSTTASAPRRFARTGCISSFAAQGAAGKYSIPAAGGTASPLDALAALA